MKSYFPIEVWAENRFFPPERQEWKYYDTSYRAPLNSSSASSGSRCVYVETSRALCHVGFANLFWFYHWQFMHSFPSLGEERVIHLIDTRIQAVTRVLNYLSTHTYSFHIEYAGIFLKSKNLCTPIFPWLMISVLLFHSSMYVYRNRYRKK